MLYISSWSYLTFLPGNIKYCTDMVRGSYIDRISRYQDNQTKYDDDVDKYHENIIIYFV